MSTEDLRKSYINPPLQHKPIVFWLWIGEITPDKVRRQLEEMHRDGIHRVIIYGFGGLRSPRYFSEEWFQCVGAALENGQRLNMHICLSEELAWPSGEARDYWEPYLPSRVLHERPDSAMKRIAYREEKIVGTNSWMATVPPEFLIATAARITGPGQINSQSILTIAPDNRGNLCWTVPSGEWLIQVFYLVETQGVDGGLVNLMDKEAMKCFIRIVNEEYERRFSKYFGTTIPIVYTDHEGAYGDRIAWAPELLSEYRLRYGKDLLQELPLLMYDGGSDSIKTRCQYLDVVSDLYTDSFWRQISDWWRKRGVLRTGHAWEESLQRIANWVGDLMRVQRNMDIPGVDSLLDWSLSPRDIKETESVAHFEGRMYSLEHPSVLGATSYTAPRTYRPVSNVALLWGVGVMCPMLIFSDPDQDMAFSSPWPRNPWSQYFRLYLDYLQRASFVHGTGKHCASILIYHPLETVWAYSSPMFLEDCMSPGPSAVDTGRGFGWNNPGGETNAVYNELKEKLVRAGWDYDVADRYYISLAQVKDGCIRINGETFTVLILPPSAVIYQKSLHKIVEFVQAGGTVLAIGRIPSASPESGLDDPEILKLATLLFGDPAQPGVLRCVGDRGGRAIYVTDINQLLNWLNQLNKRDIEVLSVKDMGNSTKFSEQWTSTIPPLDAYPGWTGDFMVSHWELAGLHFYWVVNELSQSRQITIRVSVTGRAEKWDPLTGNATQLIHTVLNAGTDITIDLGPYDAFHVVINPTDTVENTAKISMSEKVLLPVVTLDGKWDITLHNEVPVVYARTQIDPDASGEKKGWQLPDFDDTDWNQQWLSSERFCIKDWWLIGPFPYGIYEGHWTVFPPEAEINLSKTYEGLNVNSLGKNLPGPTGLPRASRIIKPGSKIPAEYLTGIRWQQIRSDSYIVNLDKVFGTSNIGHILAYGLTYVWSQTDRDVELRFAGDNSWRIWFNGELMAERPGYTVFQDWRECFGVKCQVRLIKGWNTLLVKVGKSYRSATGVMGMMCRFCDEQGYPLSGLLYSSTRDKTIPTTDITGLRWYRMHMPPGTGRMKFPSFTQPVMVFINGKSAEIGSDNTVEFQPVQSGVAVIACRSNEELVGVLRFIPDEGPVTLGSWTYTGLAHYVGKATYRTTFQLPEKYMLADLVLDLGEVGVVADVHINGNDAGTCIWPPYRFNISDYCHIGDNELAVTVYNTDSALRAQGEFEIRIGTYQALVNTRRLLDKLECNGLLGPVVVLANVEKK